MEGITESAEQGKGNAEIIEEFEIFFKDKSNIYKLKNDIRGMLYRTFIPAYDNMFTEDDVLSDLKVMIYTENKEWDKERYPEFKQYLISNSWNIIRKEVSRLKSQYGIVKGKKKEMPGNEKCETANEDSQVNCEEQEDNSGVNYEESDELIQVNHVKAGENLFHDGITLYTAKPKNGIYDLEHFRENEIDEAEKDLPGKEEKRLFDMRSFTEQNDLSKFEGTVMVILQKENDSKLLAIFDGKMDDKKKCVIMQECNMSSKEYNNAYRRLLYLLKKELSIQYRGILTASVLGYALIRYLYKLQSTL